MSPAPLDESRWKALIDAEFYEPRATKSKCEMASLLSQVAELFYEHGDAFAKETAQRMGVTESEVWLEVIFPSVWGVLSSSRALQQGSNLRAKAASASCLSEKPSVLSFAGRPAFQVMPSNLLEAFLLPSFRGYALFTSGETALQEKDQCFPDEDSLHSDFRMGLQPVTSRTHHETKCGDGKGVLSTLPLSNSSQRMAMPRSRPEDSGPEGHLALCLLPFNLASIGVLDIVHLLCNRSLRVVAKISEKVEFVGPYLERIFAPLVEAKSLAFIDGGPEVGAWLVARPEFRHIHLTGSARTGAKVEQIAGRGKVSTELGGVTPAIVLPDSISTTARLRHTARQIAFGVLANNGQHCVSYQVIFVPRSQQMAFEKALWGEMVVAAERGTSNGSRLLVDFAAAQRLETFIEEALVAGAVVTPSNPKAIGQRFPACLVSGINERMRLFREEAFGPVVGVMALPDGDFEQRARAMANVPELAGDLGASIFTAQPYSEKTKRLAGELKHGVVTINTYPGVAFATSVPWGAGPAGLSGHGWVHNYRFLPEAALHKVVLTAPLGKKGFGPVRWEDPWLLNVSGKANQAFAKALVRLTLAYFKKQPWKLFIAGIQLMSALARREMAAWTLDRKS